MRSWQHYLFLLVILCSGRTAIADVIYQNGFQTGNYADWTATGDGNDAINVYQGNYSIRHDGLRTLTLQISTQFYQDVALRTK
ncbi:hypothetical protein IT774_02805 [Salinimonas marina]|uniref:Uncharacterized protein n=1 Tax=Salinimonas marina TaxID=2785918 RepID=A0A7S9DYF4_9ALTE|nr:hypothetical protein [Salinimonas marina]QPG06165.1 hypothetical protein IT774_02805 [Salinimonas marina]